MSVLRYAGMAMALLIAATGSLPAQSGGLAVKKGTTYVFTSSTEGKMTQVVNGQETTSETGSDEQLKLTPTKIARDRIEWNCVFSEKPETPAQSKTKPVPQKLVTDAVGTILDLTGPGNGSKITGGGKLKVNLKIGSTRSQLRRYFMPQLAAGAKVGESWEESVDDTTTRPEMGLNLRMRTTLRYRFEGYADTLGVRVARVRWESTAIDIDGEMQTQGMTLNLAGDGTTSGVSYFSTVDGLLVARAENAEARVRVSVQQMVIPVVQRQTTTVVRVQG